jgi:hypothetical protein
MGNYLESINPLKNFTREGRKLECQLFIKKRIEINNSNISKEEKEIIKEDLWESFLENQHKLSGYRRLFREYKPEPNLIYPSMLN